MQFLEKHTKFAPGTYPRPSIDPQEIFEALENSDNAALSRSARETFHIIQKRIILNDIESLIQSCFQTAMNTKSASPIFFQFSCFRSKEFCFYFFVSLQIPLPAHPVHCAPDSLPPT